MVSRSWALLNKVSIAVVPFGSQSESNIGWTVVPRNTKSLILKAGSFETRKMMSELSGFDAPDV
jgi:hypothetical protein